MPSHTAWHRGCAALAMHYEGRFTDEGSCAQLRVQCTSVLRVLGLGDLRAGFARAIACRH